MTSREIISRVLRRDRPPRIGFNYSPFEGQPRLNDLAGAGPRGAAESRATGWVADGAGFENHWDEWGCLWRRVAGKTDKGEVVQPALPTWDHLTTWQPPTLGDPARYTHLAAQREQQPGQYLLGHLHGCAFNYARYLRRFEQYLLDCAAEPAKVTQLNRLLNDLAIAQVDLYAAAGCDGVMIGEDWGTEDRLLVSPAMWQAMFRPDFERLIGHCHARGLTFWMHSCGYVVDIIPSLVEIGVDVFQFDQPELSGLDFLGQFDVTYWSPVDIQWVLPHGDRALIEEHAQQMLAKLGGRGGGLIVKDYPDNPSIGVEPLWQHWGYEVFRQHGNYA
ncbi:MAG: hypothetical protein IT204_10730 [Fimbriimonadaceae bacterium]|nr:hypothetical protein [Fimbriimonadaceae bacterium]